MAMRTNPKALRSLIKECRSVANDRQTPGTASEALATAAGALEAYALDMAQAPMRLFRVKYHPADPTHLQVEWAATRREANRLAKDDRGDVTEVVVPADSAGMIAFLNKISL